MATSCRASAAHRYLSSQTGSIGSREAFDGREAGKRAAIGGRRRERACGVSCESGLRRRPRGMANVKVCKFVTYGTKASRRGCTLTTVPKRATPRTRRQLDREGHCVRADGGAQGASRKEQTRRRTRGPLKGGLLGNKGDPGNGTGDRSPLLVVPRKRQAGDSRHGRRSHRQEIGDARAEGARQSDVFLITEQATCRN